MLTQKFYCPVLCGLSGVILLLKASISLSIKWDSYHLLLLVIRFKYENKKENIWHTESTQMLVILGYL